MIDIHTHILPGIDDGAARLEDSVALARAAAAEGIKTIIATPHHLNGRYVNPTQVVEELTRTLNELLQELDIPLDVYTGQEVRLHQELLEHFQQGSLLTLAGSSYMLLELPSSHIPKNTEQTVYELGLLGIHAVIAHPERNAAIIQQPARLEELVRLGAFGQVTSHSLLGAFGKTVERASWKLCEAGLIHLVSSDAHHVERRGFRLKEAYDRIQKVMGTEWSDYFQQNASSLLRGEALADAPDWQSGAAANRWQAFKAFFKK
ncbi:protein-tyrosine phosphatase [Paenibacillus algorifonticola]|uniref:Tyrosine-protein phosphatase n=1 Tax=Paenibacillus algorifonticola TaxID=684063 RepID=A0A1I2GD37_9BACL|nr:CpsB/CapC family capsule biosynthesis tyrosine phosphatase [Paenibacillus algorifonticola]SFF15412.1 protein-tyrosine phosphatase [Paenibacillus algorifonticola]